MANQIIDDLRLNTSPGINTGLWKFPPAQYPASTAAAIGTFRYYAAFIPACSGLIGTVGFEATVVPDATNKARCAFYTNANGFPGSLIQEADAEITPAVGTNLFAFTGGVRSGPSGVWVVIIISATSAPTLRAGQTGDPWAGPGALDFQTVNKGWYSPVRSYPSVMPTVFDMTGVLGHAATFPLIGVRP
ncbi:hypothetical protein RD110_18620 [Rhodoferax koreense]|uniref:Uncharacterized protein n=1 Tax=Rhodoferax koreensis TaxID=1842727 RepID=A0A1P8JYY3_9BURK|nr:hypothetical protein [Rhodoferax koreense]APW38969.1 hypothetical protein RD110_18620 [Rhodoferax koreense]